PRPAHCGWAAQPPHSPSPPPGGRGRPEGGEGGRALRPTYGETHIRCRRKREGRLRRPPLTPALSPRAGRGGQGRRAARGGYFFLGAIIITICRPSSRGRDSTTMSSPRSASIRWAISRPSSWWLISRPRKRMLTLILS